MNDRLEYRRSLGLPKDPPVYRAYRCGMCEEEFFVEHIGDDKPSDTACPNCGSDETELDLPACLPDSGYRS